MILCLDVGNTQLYGGIFAGEDLLLRFRYDTRQATTSDQFGIFLKLVLRENGLSAQGIQHIAICSVVPHLDYSLRSACIKYFNLEPFILNAKSINKVIEIKYHQPEEVGADRLANALAVIHRYPNQNIIVIDFGTATTCCGISANKEYLGGVIMPGIRLSMEALVNNTAKLAPVEIIKPKTSLGLSTRENIQAGLYYGQLGAVREIVNRFTSEFFNVQPLLIIGTGGFAHLFEQENLFNKMETDLVLHGLKLALNYQLAL